MIMIDMPLPDRCINCPCSYWIQSGEYAGMLMCEAIEYRFGFRGLDRTGECIVSESMLRRPDNCPIRGVSKH